MDQAFNDLKIGKMEYNHCTYSYFCDMKRDCEDLVLSKQNSAFTALITRRISRLDEFITALRRKQIGVDTMRPEPAALLVTGNPGSLKSTLVQRVCNVLAGDDVKQVHQRNPASPYWEGYNNEKVCFFDDFGQTRDTVGQVDSEYMMIINAINGLPFPLNMAGVEHKGDKYFTSHYVAATTNQAKLESNSIRSNRAVQRRFKHFCFKIKPNAEYAQATDPYAFDLSKFEADENGTLKIHNDHFKFQRLNAFTGLPLAEELWTISDVINGMKEHYAKNVATYRYNLEQTTQLFNEIYQAKDDSSETSSVDYSDDLEKLFEDEKEEFTLTPTHTDEGFKEKMLKSKTIQSTIKILAEHGYSNLEAVDALVSFYVKKGTSSFKSLVRMTPRTMAVALRNAGVMTIKTMKKFNTVFAKEWKHLIQSDDYLNSLSTIAASCIPLACIAKLYFAYSGATELQSANANIPVRSQKAVNIKPLTQTTVGHLQLDEGGIDMYSKMMRYNCYLLYRDGVRLGMATFVADRYAIVPAHFVHYWNRELEEFPERANDVVYLKPCLTRSKECTDFAFTLRTIMAGLMPCGELELTDCAILYFPSMRSHKNIVDEFKTSNNHKDYFDQAIRLGFNYENQDIVKNDSTGRIRKVKGNNVQWVDGQTVYTEYAYRMQAPNRKGMCGFWLCELNSSLQKKKIIGFHHGGDQSEAIFVAIDGDLLKKTLDSYIVIDDPTINNVTVPQMADPLNNQFLIIREDRKIPKSGKTTIVKSRMYGKIIEPLTAPAALAPVRRNGIMVNPGVLALQRYNKNQYVNVNVTSLINLVDSEKDFFKNHRKEPANGRIYTFDEAILGIDDSPEFSAISRKSSPGYPYIFERDKKGKKDWFGEESEFDLSNDKCVQLRFNIDQKIEMMKNKIRPEFIFIDCLKDETLPWSKIKEGRSRIFSACGLDMLILYRMYFGDFMRDFVVNRIDNGSAIGTNPYSEDWHAMAMRLLDVNTAVNAGDFSGFDTRQSQQLLEAIYWIVEDYYPNATDEEKLIRRILWMEMYNSNHLYEGILYRWDGCLSSGNPLTAIVNSMMHRLVMKLSFRDAIDSKNDYLFWTFNEKVFLLVLGDDGCFTVDPEYSSRFNEFNAGDYLSLYGMKYTPEDKETERTGIVRGIEEVSFLKRNWRYEEVCGRFVGPLKLDSLLNQLNWTKRHDSTTISIDKCNHVARELSLHGKDIFNEHIYNIDRCMQEEYGVGLNITSWIMLLTECTNLIHDTCRVFLQYNDEYATMHTLHNSGDTDFLSCDDGENSIYVNDHKLVELQMDSYDPKSSDPSEAIGDSKDLTVLADAAVVSGSTTVPKKLVVGDNDFKAQSNVDIIRFLEKPTEIIQGDLSASDNATTFGTWNWETPINNSTMKQEKLKGIYSIQATLCLRLDVNANRFQQGLYILAYMPLGGTSTDTGDWLYMHRATITQVLQLPHVKLDLACDTSAMLRIPWRSVYNSTYTDSTSFTNPGKFFLYPYEALTAVNGTLDASYTLWGWYEDIKLGAVGYLQMGKKDILDKEQKTGSRVISDTLGSAGALATNLARIPTLSAFAGPLAWALEGLRAGAHAMGFSKPNLVTDPVRAVRTNQPYMGVSDGADASEPLSLFKNNHVSQDGQYFGTDADEMSIDFLKSIPCYIESAEWNTSTARNSLLLNLPVTPTANIRTVTDDVVTYEAMGPLGLMTKLFAAWTGTLVYTFRIVKTNYHSGRLLVTYRPYAVRRNVPGNSTTSERDYMFRTEIDIREKNVFKLEVPYVGLQPWMTTYPTYAETGTLEVFVLNTLEAPDSVSSTVHIKVEQCGGRDFKVAAPKNFEDRPVANTILQMDSGNSGEDAMVCQFDQTRIGNMDIAEENLASEEASMGEVVKSLRPILKRGGLMLYQQTTSDPAETSLILPYNNYIGRIVAGAFTGSKLNLTRDPYSLFSSMYAGSRGGVRMRFLPTNSEKGHCYYISFNAFDGSGGNLNTCHNFFSESLENTYARSGQIGNAPYINLAPTASVVCPPYTYQYSRPTNSLQLSPIRNTNYEKGEEPIAQLRFKTVSVAAGETVRCNVWRGGADDCSFGIFVSVPPLTTNRGV
eukprot:GHVU01090819.1.p1 GENE.GHVU01090819.1~~GHVU01090819.1.p1  ORF type:complete len:2087 (-),score=131.58 GHVU01090819.1:112-6372(-)